MSIEIALLLKQVLDLCYYNVCEIRVLFQIPTNDYALELKKVGETLYFEDEGAVLHHLEEVLVSSEC